jgi:hypothetical protein
VVGDDFFTPKPFVKINSLFVHLKKIVAQQTKAENILAAGDSAAMRKVAEALGYLEAARGSLSIYREYIMQCLTHTQRRLRIAIFTISCKS